MRCPFCGVNDDKVIDSREVEGGRTIRRRRQCKACGKRFTTQEAVAQRVALLVIKRDDSRVPYDRQKVTDRKEGWLEAVGAVDFDGFEVDDAGVVGEALFEDAVGDGLGFGAVAGDDFDLEVVEAGGEGGLVEHGVEVVSALAADGDEGVPLAAGVFDDFADVVGEEVLDDDGEFGGGVEHGLVLMEL